MQQPEQREPTRRAGAGRVRLRSGQDGQRLLELTEVRASTRGDDAHLVGLVAGELGRLGPARQLERPFRPTEAAFAVGYQRKQR